MMSDEEKKELIDDAKDTFFWIALAVFNVSVWLVVVGGALWVVKKVYE
jgi:hypothetical protein